MLGIRLLPCLGFFFLVVLWGKPKFWMVIYFCFSFALFSFLCDLFFHLEMCIIFFSSLYYLKSKFNAATADYVMCVVCYAATLLAWGFLFFSWLYFKVFNCPMLACINGIWMCLEFGPCLCVFPFGYICGNCQLVYDIGLVISNYNLGMPLFIFQLKGRFASEQLAPSPPSTCPKTRNTFLLFPPRAS